jgi:hypothetical protein
VPTLVPAKPKPIPNLTVASAETTYEIANQLYFMGLFEGTGNDAENAPVFELERSMSRIESLALIIRLLGLEDAASKSSVRNPFLDVPLWGEKTAAYAYSIGLVVGINQEHTILAADRLISAKEFSALLLRVLGYHESSGDFSFDQAVEKAVAVNLYKLIEPAKLKGSEMLRGEAVVAIADALISYTKSADTRLIDKLVTDGAVNKDAADGFISSYDKVKK